jgi:hypothetical protein
MDYMAYGINVLVVASSWMVGIFLARYILRTFFSIEPDGPTEIGSVSGDDLLDFDKADMPYIPVTIIRENGLYYGWFKGNNKFIGQAKKVGDIHKMAHEHVMKQMGLRFEFVREKDKVIT